MIGIVRTTIEIDDDVLTAVKELAANRKTMAGRVLSDLVRQELQQAERQTIANVAAIEAPPKKRSLG